jgi:hypothetical protein
MRVVWDRGDITIKWAPQTAGIAFDGLRFNKKISDLF